MQGVVLQTYGAGNVPDTKSNSYLFEELKVACERGVIIVNCTQCSSGVVTDLYAGSIVSCELARDCVMAIVGTVVNLLSLVINCCQTLPFLLLLLFFVEEI